MPLLQNFENQFWNVEAYSEPSQTCKINILAKTVTSFQPLTILTKNSISDVWPGSKYASVMSYSSCQNNQATGFIY